MSSEITSPSNNLIFKLCKTCRARLFVMEDQQEIRCLSCKTLHGVSKTQGNKSRGDNTGFIRLWIKREIIDNSSLIYPFICRKKRTYISEIMKNLNLTYYEVTNEIIKLEKENKIDVDRRRRTKYISVK